MSCRLSVCTRAERTPADQQPFPCFSFLSPLLSHSATMDYPQDDDSYYPQAASRGSLMNGQSGQNFYQSSGASSPRLGSQQQGGYAYPPPLKGSVSGLSSNSDGSGKGWYAGGSPRREEQVGSVGYHQSRESRGPNQGRY